MTSPTYYLDVFKALNDAGARYIVVGGIAVGLHGIPRNTFDLDIMIDLEQRNILTINHALSHLGYVPRVPVNPEDFADETTRNEWVAKKNMLVFSWWKSSEQYRIIDIVFHHPFDFDACYSRRVERHDDAINIPLIEINDLIAMKRFANRKQDLSDIEALEQVKRIYG